MATHNDITGDKIATKNISEDFRTGWDRIFGKKSNKEIESLDSELLPPPNPEDTPD